MSHLDEGRLHALLDGELPPADRAEAERHLAACAECRRLREEASQFLAEADDLIATVEPPALPRSRPAAPTSVAAARWARWRGLAWAASLALAVGLGWYASGLRFVGPTGTPDVGARVVPSAPAPASRPVDSLTAAATNTGRQRVQPRTVAEERVAESAAPTAPAGPATLGKAAPEPHQAARSDAVKLAEPVPAPAETRDQAVPAPAAVAAPTPTAGLAARAQAENRLADEAATDLREITMAEAVRVLGGTIRLIDGATPRRVLLGYHLIPGADSVAGVRVVYEDPPARELWLDQQPEVMPGSRGEAARVARRVTQWLPGDTLAGPGPGARQSLRWRDEHGFLLALSGYLPDDSLRGLARRVH